MTKVVKQLSRSRSCGHFAINHHGGGGGKPDSGRCVVPLGDGICKCPEFVEGSSDAAQQDASWYERAINAASRIDTTHTTPWKVALVYSMLAIAESLGASARTIPLEVSEPPSRRSGDTDKDLLTAQDVARMTGLSVHTLSWWRFKGGGGPKHLKAWPPHLLPASGCGEVAERGGWRMSDAADRLAQALRDLINEAVQAAMERGPGPYARKSPTGRPRLPIGAHGKIARIKRGDGLWLARCRYRDSDGVIRVVQQLSLRGSARSTRSVRWSAPETSTCRLTRDHDVRVSPIAHISLCAI